MDSWSQESLSYDVRSHVCSFNQMNEELIREHAEANFGTGYFPLAHGSPEAAKPFGLMVKKKRSKLKRPWKNYEYEILDGLVKYVQKDKENEFSGCLKFKRSENR